MAAKDEGDNSRLTRWSLNLQPYQIEVQYRPGKKNGNADGLSRMWGPRLNDDVVAGKGGGDVKDRGRPFLDDLGDARGLTCLYFPYCPSYIKSVGEILALYILAVM